jgi:WD40 repeat protein
MKKRNSGIFAVLAFLTVLVLCSFRYKPDDSDSFNEKDFAEKIDLKGSILQFDDLIMKPTGIHVIDNLLIVPNSRTEYIFDVFDLNTNKKINACIGAGQGPGEMLSPKIVNLTKDSIWIYDTQRWFLYNYAMKDFISKSRPESVSERKFGHYSRITILSDNKIVASPSTNTGKKFDYYDLNAKLLYSKGEYPEEKLPDMNNIMVYRFDYTAGANSRIFVSYGYIDLIEIYDASTGNLIKRRQGPNNHKPPALKHLPGGEFTVVVTDKSSTYLCYPLSPLSAGDEAFVLYFGVLAEKQQDTGCTRILVFDFEGNPLRIYNLDIPVSFFTVDADKRIIYGVASIPDAEDDFNIVKYEY